MAGDAGSEGNLNPKIIQVMLNLNSQIKSLISSSRKKTIASVEYLCEKLVVLTLIKFKFRRMTEQSMMWSMKLYSVGGVCWRQFQKKRDSIMHHQEGQCIS